MKRIAGRRMTAEIDGDFVVFLIGFRINDKWHAWRSRLDVGGRRGMQHMLEYLASKPEKGLLGFQVGFPFRDARLGSGRPVGLIG